MVDLFFKPSVKLKVQQVGLFFNDYYLHNVMERRFS